MTGAGHFEEVSLSALMRIPVLTPAFLFLPFLLAPPGNAAPALQGQRDAQDYIRRLESPERVERLQIERVIQTLSLRPGMYVADLGAGSGLFSRPMARILGNAGVLYAVDVDPALLEHVQKTAREQAIGNIRTVPAAEDDPLIPERVDLIFVCDTLHHIGGKPEYLKNLRRYLKPDGRIAIIDFLEDWPPGHEEMRYSVEELDGWMAEAGWSLAESHDFLGHSFLRIYR